MLCCLLNIIYIERELRKKESQQYLELSAAPINTSTLRFPTRPRSTSVQFSSIAQSCPTLCDPIDGSPTGSSVPGILQGRTLEWVAISFSNAWKWKVKVKSLSRVQLLVTPRLQPTRLLHPWDFPGESAGVGCHCLLHSSTTAIIK